MTKIKIPKIDKHRAGKAKVSGAYIPNPIPSCITREVRKQRLIYRHREIFQMLILGEKYSTIANKLKMREGCISMIVIRYAPHLLRGRGNRGKAEADPKPEITPVKEKNWNPKTLKYE